MPDNSLGSLPNFTIAEPQNQSIVVLQLRKIHWSTDPEAQRLWNVGQVVLINFSSLVSHNRICLEDVDLRKKTHASSSHGPLTWNRIGCKDGESQSLISLYFEVGIVYDIFKSNFVFIIHWNPFTQKQWGHRKVFNFQNIHYHSRRTSSDKSVPLFGFRWVWVAEAFWHFFFYLRVCTYILVYSFASSSGTKARGAFNTSSEQCFTPTSRDTPQFFPEKRPERFTEILRAN